MKKKHIYVLDHKLKWKTFKALQDKLVKQSGPVPQNIDKILWEMLRDKRIYCWFDSEFKNDMKLGLELPKNKEHRLITNPTKRIKYEN